MPPSDASDGALMVRTSAGDHDAFGVLVRRHIRSATFLAVQLIGDRDDAEDLVQQAFSVVYERAPSYERGRPFAPWLFGIVRRLASNAQARQTRRRWLWRKWGSRTEDLAVLPDEHDDGAIPRGVTAAALTALSPMQRACFELVALRDLPISEVAAMYGIAEATVRQHVFRARRELRLALSSDEA